MEKAAEELELTMIDVSRSGPGVARDSDGRVVFVPGTAPGDRVRARVLKVQKRFVEAELIAVLEPSPERVKPRCSVFGRCGGCQWQHLPYERQWKTKVSGALHALARVGIEGVQDLHRQEYPASDPWGYRNRIQLRGGEFGLGYYARGSHQVVSIERCEIAREELNRALPAFIVEARSRGAPSKLELEIIDSGKLLSSWNSRHAARGFRQIHDAQNLLLRSWISDRLLPGEILYDLYGGSGNLSLGLSDRFGEVHCVDVGAARQPADSENATLPENFRFHSLGVGNWAKKWRIQQKNRSGGACVIDPPREGCGEDLIPIVELLDESRITQLIAVGCDPDSWARDLSRLVRKRWKLRSLAFFDFFPQTTHFESAAFLERV